MYICLADLDDRLKTLMPIFQPQDGMGQCLFVLPDQHHITTAEIGALCGALEPLLPGFIVSCRRRQAFPVRTASEEYASLKGKLRVSAEGVVLSSGYELEYCVGGLSSIATELPLVGPSKAGSLRSEIVFLPAEMEGQIDWTKLGMGLAWLHLCDSWVANSPEPLFNAHAVLQSFVGIAVSMGIIVGLRWRDSNDKQGLVLFGSDPILWDVHEKLTESAVREDPDCVGKLVSVGFGLDLLH